MISRSKIKFIKSLQVKKYRQEAQSFIVEGAKSVEELLKSDFEVSTVVVSEPLARAWEQLLHRCTAEVIVATHRDFEGLGSFQTNETALAVAAMKAATTPRLVAGEFGLALDDVRDPGNLGAIIRTAHWYGCRNIVASLHTTDVYNPKVIAASMGSFIHVNMYYADLASFLRKNTATAYGTFLDGHNVHEIQFKSSGWIVVGNEANGISAEVAACVPERITIPRYSCAESLNASIATAVVLDNLQRSRHSKK